MKSQMKTVVLALTLTLGVCLLFPAVASAQEGQQCPQDPVNMFIAYGADILCGIDQPGTSDLFRFNGTAGERIKLETLGTDRPCMELVGITTACGGNGQNWIDTVLPTTQQYTLRVYDGNNSTNTYSLFLERTVPYNPDARAITYGQNDTGQFDLAGDLDEFFFTASSDGTDVVDIQTLSTKGRPCFTLYAPDGKTTWNVCGGNGSDELRTPQLPAGNYTILLYDGNGGATDYRVILECITGTCNVATIPALSGFLTLRGAPLANQLVGLVTPGPGGQTTTTDQNGYFQFLHVPNGNFTEYAPISGKVNDASAASVHSDPDR